MVKILYSKRNRVAKIGKIVCKTVKTSTLAKQEVLRIQLLHKKGVAVPKVYGTAKNNIILKYVNGTPLPDWLLDKELTTKELQNVADSLVFWLKSFYKGVKQNKTKIILEDVNCRNFLVCKDGKICGLDFEGLTRGEKEENVGELITYIKNYDLCDENKNIFADRLLKSATSQLSLNKEGVMEEEIKANKRMIKRRGRA